MQAPDIKGRDIGRGLRLFPRMKSSFGARGVCPLHVPVLSVGAGSAQCACPLFFSTHCMHAYLPTQHAMPCTIQSSEPPWRLGFLPSSCPVLKRS